MEQSAPVALFVRLTPSRFAGHPIPGSPVTIMEISLHRGSRYQDLKYGIVCLSPKMSQYKVTVACLFILAIVFFYFIEIIDVHKIGEFVFLTSNRGDSRCY